MGRRRLVHLNQGGRQAKLGGALPDQLHGEGNRKEAVVRRGEESSEEYGDAGSEDLQPQRTANEDADPAGRRGAEGGLGWLRGLELLRIRLSA
jgi:hypothetical protein